VSKQTRSRLPAAIQQQKEGTPIIMTEPKAPAYETLLFICCGVAFACYFGSYMRIPVVPLFARSLGATTAQVGMINSGFLLMAGLLSLPLGILSDRLGRKLLIICGLLISSCTSLFLYFATTPMQMVWIYLFFGTGLAAFGPTMMSFVADFSPATHLGRAYGWYTTALYGGMSLGPAAGGFLAQALGFHPVFLISGAFIFLMVWMVVFLLPQPHQILAHRPPKRGTLEIAGELLGNRPLLACWMVTLGGCFGLGMFITFVPLYAHNRGLSIGQIGLIFTAQALCNAVSRIPFGQLSDRVSNRANLILVGFVGFAVAIAAFAFAQQTLHFMLLATALGISMGLAFTPLGALISEVVPLESRGLAMGGYNTCIYLGMMLSSAVMGAVIPAIGFEKGFFMTGLINIVAILLFYLVIREK
jgi:MFS transporter, DHA1 family, multidrug resistance protein